MQMRRPFRSRWSRDPLPDALHCSPLGSQRPLALVDLLQKGSSVQSLCEVVLIIQRVSQPVDPVSGRVMYKVPGQGYACALFSPNVSTESCNQAVLR